jgi:hypothetical protein
MKKIEEALGLIKKIFNRPNAKIQNDWGGYPESSFQERTSKKDVVWICGVRDKNSKPFDYKADKEKKVICKMAKKLKTQRERGRSSIFKNFKNDALELFKL